eukprot:scaffold187084_cov36-Tisochrysis_lutea.AAC.4
MRRRYLSKRDGENSSPIDGKGMAMPYASRGRASVGRSMGAREGVVCRVVLYAEQLVEPAEIGIVCLGEYAEWDVHPCAVRVPRMSIHPEHRLLLEERDVVLAREQVGGSEPRNAGAHDGDALGGCTARCDR